jgi:hypothetical protein
MNIQKTWWCIGGILLLSISAVCVAAMRIPTRIQTPRSRLVPSEQKRVISKKKDALKSLIISFQTTLEPYLSDKSKPALQVIMSGESESPAGLVSPRAQAPPTPRKSEKQQKDFTGRTDI